MQEPTEIKVMGQMYVLKGSYDKKYVRRVEEFINDKIREVQEKASSTNTRHLMVLVALNLVDDYLKKEEEIKQFVNTIEGQSENLINIIDANI
jgi:cell division protein ZapA